MKGTATPPRPLEISDPIATVHVSSGTTPTPSTPTLNSTVSSPTISVEEPMRRKNSAIPVIDVSHSKPKDTKDPNSARKSRNSVRLKSTTLSKLDFRKHDTSEGSDPQIPQKPIAQQVFDYFMLRHPWFAENWEKLEIELKDQTYVDVENIILGRAPALHVEVKQKWAKHDTNLDTILSEQTYEQFSRARNQMDLVCNKHINELQNPLPKSTYDSSQSTWIFTEMPDLPVQDLIRAATTIVTLITEAYQHPTIETMVQTIQQICSKDFYNVEAKEHILKAASMEQKPLYLQNLLLVKLQGMLERWGSLVIQFLQIVSSIDRTTRLLSHRKIWEMLACLKTIISYTYNQLRVVRTMVELAHINSTQTILSSLTIPDRDRMDIWKYQENMLKFSGGFPANGAGTLNSLVLTLTDPDHLDSSFAQTFITTYRSFTTPEQLFTKLLERYQIPESCPPEDRSKVQLRISVTFKLWIETHIRDFDDELLGKLHEFINQLYDDGLTNMAERLQATLRAAVIKETARPVFQCVSLKLTEPHNSPSDILAKYSPQDIAEQLSYISSRIFAAIDTNELLDQNWSSKKSKHKSPHVLELMKRSNRLSFWVATMILFHERLKDRSMVLSKLIQVAQELHRMQNFDGLIGFVAGLNNAAVSRLKFSQLSVNEVLLLAMEEMTLLMNPEASWKAYRSVLRACTPPVIPYLGVYLGDLTFIGDGNTDFLPEKGDLINFGKRELVNKVISEIKMYQLQTHKIEPIPELLTYLTELPHLTDKILYSLSLQREPRDASFATLI